MIAETEGIVLRQTKAANGRRLIELFTKKYGKISVGSGLSEGGKNKAALLTRPFTYGDYQLYKGSEIYNLNGGHVLKSFYSIGEDIDKYSGCAYALELTDKILPDEIAQPKLFVTLRDFLKAIEKRTKQVDTLVIVYMVKVLSLMGTEPVLDKCSCCGQEASDRFFSVEDGGIICEKCFAEKNQHLQNEKLIFDTDFGIVDILKYCNKEPFRSFEKIAINGEVSSALLDVLKSFLSYHYDIKDLKSEEFFFCSRNE